MLLTLLQSLGPEGLIVFLLLLIGIVHNSSIQEVKRDVRHVKLDQIEIRLQLVEAGTLTIAQTRDFFERQRESEHDDNSVGSALMKLIEKAV